MLPFSKNPLNLAQQQSLFYGGAHLWVSEASEFVGNVFLINSLSLNKLLDKVQKRSANEVVSTLQEGCMSTH